MPVSRRTHIIVVAASKVGPSFQLSAQIGSRFPALISATGRCIAAFGGYREDELRARFKALKWDDPPRYTEWKKQVELTHERRFAVDPGNYISGVTVVSAPVWNSPTLLGHGLVAIGIGGGLKRTLETLQTALVDEARALSRKLNGG